MHACVLPGSRTVQLHNTSDSKSAVTIISKLNYKTKEISIAVQSTHIVQSNIPSQLSLNSPRLPHRSTSTHHHHLDAARTNVSSGCSHERAPIFRKLATTCSELPGPRVPHVTQVTLYSLIKKSMN